MDAGQTLVLGITIQDALNVALILGFFSIAGNLLIQNRPSDKAEELEFKLAFIQFKLTKFTATALLILMVAIAVIVHVVSEKHIIITPEKGEGFYFQVDPEFLKEHGVEGLPVLPLPKKGELEE